MTSTWPESARSRPRHEARPSRHLTVIDGGAEGLMVADLMSDFPTLLAMLAAEVEAGHCLDAFLLASGASQVLEDHLRSTRAPFFQAASAARALRGGHRLHGLRRQGLIQLTETLAAGVLDGERLDAAALPQVEALTSTVTARIEGIPQGLQREVMRPPSSFRSFDQRPADMARLAGLFTERWARRDRPVAVVGVGTSGSYLAPLCAAAMRADGFSRLHVTTLRPGCGMTRAGRRRLLDMAAAGGVLALVGAPPRTGSMMRQAIRALAAAGVRATSLVVMLAHFDAEPEIDLGVPGINRIDLEWPQWAVHHPLTAREVAGAMGCLVGPRLEVCGVEAVGAPTIPLRGHVRARFRIRLHDRRTGASASEDVVVEGAGLGYLGRQSLAVARALPGQVPPVFGFDGGLLYRRWLPESERIRWIADPERAARGIARYAASRARALPASADHSLSAAGRQPVWEVAGSIVARPMGRLGVSLRPGLVDPIVKRLLRVDRPSIPDCQTDPHWWFRSSEPGAASRMAKVGFADGAFSHLGLATYDPVFDLAGAAVSAATPVLGRALRAAYREESGGEVSPERWLLHELVQLWDLRRRGQRPPEEVDAKSARAVQLYLAALYLSDLGRNGASASAATEAGDAARIGYGTPPADAGPGSTPWCALELDGVLETSSMGFPASTRAGLEALRALVAHGYRPLLASGRSLADVRDRCLGYGLAGGVAEHGGVVYSRRDGAVTDLLPPGALGAFQVLRQHLEGLEGVRVDPRHRYSVRAWRIRPGGERAPLDQTTIERALAAAGAEAGSAGDRGLRAVPGPLQTDFTVHGVDKGRGIRCLLSQLAGGTATAPAPLVLAVGAGAGDLPMLALAETAMVTSNADRSLRSGCVPVTPAPYQAGLRQAVASLIGHRPGACPACRAPRLTDEAQDLTALLSVDEAGKRGMAARLARLRAAAGRAGRKP